MEDVAASEVRRLGANLRPLLLVYLIAPLLGLLGTVWGMIEAFSEIAMQYETQSISLPPTDSGYRNPRKPISASSEINSRGYCLASSISAATGLIRSSQKRANVSRRSFCSSESSKFTTRLPPRTCASSLLRLPVETQRFRISDWFLGWR